MTVISASSAGVKDMADGSLRITFEFEPRHAADAFALFGPRGRSVAIAALADGHAAVTEKPVSEEPKKEREWLGDLCYRAVQWCNDKEFRQWLRDAKGAHIRDNADDAGRFVCEFCGIDSRKDLDTNLTAQSTFIQEFLGPYRKHLLARGLV